MRTRDAVVHELVAHRFPGLAAVARSLNLLPEPAARLRRIKAVGIDGRSFQMVNLPAGEVRTSDVPVFTLAIRCHDERALPCSNKNAYPAHQFLTFELAKSAANRARVEFQPGIKPASQAATYTSHPTPNRSASIPKRRGRKTSWSAGGTCPPSARAKRTTGQRRQSRRVR